jgi:hypothetical protein
MGRNRLARLRGRRGVRGGGVRAETIGIMAAAVFIAGVAVMLSYGLACAGEPQSAWLWGLFGVACGAAR